MSLSAATNCDRGRAQYKRQSAKESLASKIHHYKKKRTDNTINLYKKNFNRIIPQHHYEQRKGVDQTYIVQKEVPFKKMTKKDGFEPVMREEAAARNIELTEEEMTNYNNFIKKFKQHVRNKDKFKPMITFERFKWY